MNATGFFRKFRKSGRGESEILDFKLKIEGKVGGETKGGCRFTIEGDVWFTGVYGECVFQLHT